VNRADDVDNEPTSASVGKLQLLSIPATANVQLNASKHCRQISGS